MRCIAPSAELRYPMAPRFARAVALAWVELRTRRSLWRFRVGMRQWATLLRLRRQPLLRGGRPRKVLRLTWRRSLVMRSL